MIVKKIFSGKRVSIPLPPQKSNEDRTSITPPPRNEDRTSITPPPRNEDRTSSITPPPRPTSEAPKTPPPTPPQIPKPQIPKLSVLPSPLPPTPEDSPSKDHGGSFSNRNINTDRARHSLIGHGRISVSEGSDSTTGTPRISISVSQESGVTSSLPIRPLAPPPKEKLRISNKKEEIYTPIWVQIGPKYDPIKIEINTRHELRVTDLQDIITSHEELSTYIKGGVHIYHCKENNMEKLQPLKRIDFSVIGEDLLFVKILPHLETGGICVQERKSDKIIDSPNSKRTSICNVNNVNNNTKNLHKILKEMLLPASGLVKERRTGNSMFPSPHKQLKQCMVACEIVDWLIKEKYAETREKAVEIGRALVQSSMIYDIRESGEHFEDNQTCYKVLEVEVDFKTLLSPMSMEVFEYDKSKLDTYTPEEFKLWLYDVNLRDYGDIFSEEEGLSIGASGGLGFTNVGLGSINNGQGGSIANMLKNTIFIGGNNVGGENSTTTVEFIKSSSKNNPEEKKMFSVDKDNEHKIILDKASREKSLELFLVHPQADLGHIFNINEYTQTFLFTFPSFMPPLNLLRFLTLRFNDPNTLLIEKERITSIINDWMNIDNGYDFHDNEMILTVEQLISSLNKTQSERFCTIAQFFQKKLNRIIHDKEERDHPRKFFCHLPPDPILPIPGTKFQIFDVDPQELARQITLLVEKYMMAMTRHELLKENYDPKNRKEHAHSINHMLEFAEHLSGVCIAEILKESSMEMQALRYTYFVEVAEELKKLNNFFGVGCIIGALNGAAIPKLKKMIKSLDNRITKKFEALKYLIVPNFAQDGVDPYKDATDAIHSNEPIIPLLHSRLGLGTLTKLNEVHKDILKDPDGPTDGWINWQKLTKLAKIIAHIKRSQTGYSLIDIPEIQQVILTSESWHNENINCHIAELRNSQENSLPVENMTRVDTLMLFDSEWVEPNQKDWSTIIKVTKAKLIEFKDQQILDYKSNYIYRLIEGTIQIKRKEEPTTPQENPGNPNNSTEVLPLTSRASSIVRRSKNSALILQANNTFGELSIFGITPSACVVTGISSGMYYEIEIEKIIHLCLCNDTISRKFNHYITHKIARKSKQKKNFSTSTKSKDDTTRKRIVAPQNKMMNEVNFEQGEKKLGEYKCVRCKSPTNQTDCTFIITEHKFIFNAKVFGIGKMASVRQIALVQKIELNIKDESIRIDKILLKQFEQHQTLKSIYDYLIILWEKEKQAPTLCVDPKIKEDEEYVEIPAPVSLNTNTRSSLTLDTVDWKLISHRIQPFHCNTNDVILQKGSFCPKLYQIVSGSVKETNMSGYVSEYKKDDIFGEVGFVNAGVASATYEALEKTQLIAIEGYYLVVLFQLDPSLAGRFFHYLGKVMYQRLISDDPSTFI